MAADRKRRIVRIVAAPIDLDAVERLLDSGDLDGARSALARARGEEADVLRLRLGMLDGSVSPNAVMQRLVVLMQGRPGLARASDLYTEASQRAYDKHQSSMSHSHPPPPMTPKDKGS